MSSVFINVNASNRFSYNYFHLVSHLNGIIIRFEHLLKRAYTYRFLQAMAVICVKSKFASHPTHVFHHCKDPCASINHMKEKGQQTVIHLSPANY